MKTCRICDTKKSLDDFYVKKENRDGYFHECKNCLRVRRLERHRSDPSLRESERERNRRWHRENREAVIARQREKRAEAGAQEQRRRARLQASFGISLEEYNRMAEEQGHVCKICGLPSSGKPLHVDHDHDTGNIRGLLCFRCNVGLGMFSDSIVNLESAIRYLRDKRY